MNNYIIWLCGGKRIRGIASSTELLELKKSFIKFKCPNGGNIVEFEDDKESNIVDLKEVQAISIGKKMLDIKA
jgi:hypothetical protein